MKAHFYLVLLPLFVETTSPAAQDTDPIPVMSDTMNAFLNEIPVEAVVAELGDSLYAPGKGRARIVRDRYGVPHIFGKTDLEVAFGFGYAQSEDHLIEMLLNYRAAAGRRSEILGQEHLEEDYKALLWRIHTVAGERYGSIPESVRAFIGAFVEGVNHYIEVHEPVLPSWVEPVSGADVVALGRWINLYFAESTGRPELKKKNIRSISEAPIGSNQWVVRPPRSATEGPVFAADLHLPWSSPLQVYEAHLVSREGLNVSGATFFGIPVIIVGHNDRIAWSLTVNEADIFDLYEEKLDPANPKRYVYEREKHRMSSRRVKIKVRSGQGIIEAQRELLYTHHGPVYKVVGDWAYAARSSVEDLVNTIGQLYEMNRSKDLKEFKRAMARLELPMFNVMYGDVDGNIFYVFNSRSPIRLERFDWRSAVPGWTVETEWRGVVVFDQLPQITNPVSNFLQNCNTAPDFVTVDSGLEVGAYPSFLGWGSVNDRSRRVFSWLWSTATIGPDQVKEMLRDEYLISAEELKGIVLGAYNRSWQEIYDPDGRLALAVNLLRDWDNRASVESRGTLLFSAWKERFDRLIEGIPADQSRATVVLEKLALEALRTAVEYLTTTYGRLDPLWGEVQVIERGNHHFPVGGSPPGMSSLHAIWSKRGTDGLMRAYGGSAFTMLVSLDQPVGAWSLVPHGSSEDPDSPHYSDQAELQESGTLKPAWFSETDILANLESITSVPLEEEEAEWATLRALWRQQQASEPPENSPAEGSGDGTDLE